MSDSIEMELQNYYTRQRTMEAQDAGLTEPVPPAPPLPSDLEKLGSFAKSLGLDLEPGMVETMIQQHLPNQAVSMDLVKGLDAVLKIVGVPFKAVGLAAQNIVGPILEAAHPDASPEAIQAGKEAVGTAAEFASPLLYKALGEAAPHVARKFSQLARQEAGALGFQDTGIKGFLGPNGEHYLAGREGHRFADVPKDIREKGIRYRMDAAPGSDLPTRLSVDIRRPVTNAERSEILKMAQDAETTIIDHPMGHDEAHTLEDVRKILGDASSFFKNQPTAALAQRVADVHAQAGPGGGSTHNLVTGEPFVGTSGYIVSKRGFEQSFDHAPTSLEVQKYIESLPPEIRSNPDLHIGTWEDKGTHYLDVSQHVPEKAQAMTLGAQEGQKAIYGVAENQSFPVVEEVEPVPASVGAAASRLVGSVKVSKVAIRRYLGYKIATDHPDWTLARVEAELTKVAVGVGPYVEVHDRIVEELRGRAPVTSLTKIPRKLRQR